MGCKICKRLKLKKLNQLNEKVLKGESSVFELSKEFSLPTKSLIRHIDLCVSSKEKSGYQTLRDLLTKVISDLEDARQDAMYGDEEGSKGATFLYTSLLKEARELIGTIDKMKPNEAISKELQAIAINPLVTEMARILIEEGGSLKTELQAILGESYDRDVDRAIKDAWRRMTKRINQEYRFVGGRVTAVLSGQPQSQREPSPLKPQTSQSPPSSDLH